MTGPGTLVRPHGRKPPWLAVRMPGGERYRRVRAALEAGRLHTVCEEARCPNAAECWEAGTATFLILGDTCTRGCAFCAVTRGESASAPGDAEEEAGRVAAAVHRLGLDYAVVTSVTRDDLPDGGASAFAAVVRRLRALDPAPLVEVLIPDYTGAPLNTVLAAAPRVLAHNVEVVERLTPVLRHPRFGYRRSLQVLAEAQERASGVLTKSSILLGLGERREEVLQTMEDLRRAGVEILVLGQYLQPTRAHAPVAEYLAPEVFAGLAEEARRMGFGTVAAGPLVRTSYRAAEAYARGRAPGESPSPPSPGG